jgi:Fe-S-cluster containining protein
MIEPIGTPSTKELLWLGCREKSCCHNSKVIVTGRDLWRIAQALEAAPWDFTQYCEALPGAPDGFQLAPGGPCYQIVLAKRGRVSAKGAPCVFLWKLADGHAQCGLGGLRPLVCRSYPSLLVDGMLCVESSSCTCRRWGLVDMDQRAERALLGQVLGEAEEYSAVVARWNVALEQYSGERSYREFCAYIMDVYAQQEASP